MKTIKLFSNWDNNKYYKYYYFIGRLNKDGSVRYTKAGGCSNDEAEIGEKIKYEKYPGHFGYYYIISKTEYEK